MSFVLLIEPDRQLAAVYAKTLQEQDNAVVTVAHAADAIFAADAERPDLIILELQLGGHGGVEFLYELRSYPEWAKIPVMLLTSVQPYALQITPQQMELLGIVRCLYKPGTTLRQLRRAAEECMRLPV